MAEALKRLPWLAVSEETAPLVSAATGMKKVKRTRTVSQKEINRHVLRSIFAATWNNNGFTVP